MEKIKKIGLTGVFGSGKTAVASIFKKYGIDVISCDDLVAELLEKEEVKKKLAGIFGNGVIKNGKLDKKKIAEAIFTDREKKEKLENLIHPLVFKRIDEEIKKNIDRIKKKGIIIVEIPLLFETKSEKKFDYIIVVSASVDIIKSRLREKFNDREIELRWENQLPLKFKEKNADYIINNSGPIHQTEKYVREIINEILPVRGKIKSENNFK